MHIPGPTSNPSSPRTHAAPHPGVRQILELCAECEGTRPDLDDCTHDQLLQARGFAETTNDTHAVDLIDQELADRERPAAPVWDPRLAGLAGLSLSDSVGREGGSGAPASGGAATASDFTVPEPAGAQGPLEPLSQPESTFAVAGYDQILARLGEVNVGEPASRPASFERLAEDARRELIYFERLAKLLRECERERPIIDGSTRLRLLRDAPSALAEHHDLPAVVGAPDVPARPAVPHALRALMTPDAARLHNEANCLRLRTTPSPMSPYVTLMRTMATQPAVAAEYEGMAGCVGALTADAMQRALARFNMRAHAVPQACRADDPWMAYALQLLGFAPNAR